VNLGQYLASNVFSLKEFREKMGGNNEFGTLGALEDVLAHILRYVATDSQASSCFVLIMKLLIHEFQDSFSNIMSFYHADGSLR